MIRRPPRSTHCISSAASDVYKRQVKWNDGSWLEILGCGMVDPNVLENVGYSKEYKGFAWGVGIERLAMLRYKIDHIKNFYENDIRFLEQF